MLSMTSQAAEMVDSVRSQQEVPDEYGLRVFPEETSEGVAVQLAFTPGPEEGDAVSETEGQQLFVAPELVEPLADAVLDAKPTPDGSQLVIKQPGEQG